MFLFRLAIPVLMVAAVAVQAQGKEPAAKFDVQSVQGRVTWMSAALARRYDIKESPEAAERILAIEQKDGTLHPLVEDGRGRAFRLDRRLRDIEVELMVRKYPGSPMLQVIQIFEIRADGKYELDYWCDVCSIAMYELKECECCQGPIELRLRKVK